ncbi:MAG: N-acetyltransferase [Enterocloster sp.]
MINYMQTNVLDMLECVGEDNCQNILSSFVCPLNPDVEDFIRNKAIQFAKQRIAISYLIFAEENGQRYFIGYYTLANKFVCVNGSSLSKTMQKKISKFSQYDPASKRFMVSMPLIAQLGKNFSPALPFKMAGTDLLEMALERVLEIEHLIGGKTVYIECNNQPKLFDFYSATGFFQFDTRIRQTDDPNDTDNVLVQMLKYFNH